MLTALAILGGIFAYTQIGRFVGNYAWEVRFNKNKHLFGFYLLFPVSILEDGLCLIEEFKTKRTYVLASSLFWPTRIVWPLMAGPVLGISYLATCSCYGVSYLAKNNKFLRFGLGKLGRALLFLGTPFYKLGRAAFLTFLEPENVFKGIGSGAKSIGKWLAGRKKAAALSEMTVDALPPMKEELNGLLAEQEVVGDKIRELQEKICAEEARRMGTYREAPKLAASNK